MHRSLTVLAGCASLFAGSAHAAPAANAFNPQISLILQGTYAHYSNTDEADVPGTVMGPETEFRPEGMSLAESELAIESNIDHRFHGWTTVALENENGETVVAVEEAYINTLALPAGFALKFGRFYSDIGYQNAIHTHAWDFTDTPLAYRALLANQYGDDGLQLRWVAPTTLLVELGAEALRGDGYPGGGGERGNINAWTAFAHVGGDAGIGGAWRFGLSQLRTDAVDRITGEEVETAFTGNSTVSIVDAVYKWAPQGNATERSLVIQAEYLHRSEDGSVSVDPAGSAETSAYKGSQDGWYAQVIYGFMRSWRAGVRYGQVTSDNTLDNPAAGTALETLANAADDTPHRASVMLDWSPSEFSRFRLQFNRDNSRPGEASDNQVIAQYIFSLGSHPAHQF